MANNIKDQIIENIERNDPNYKIIDLTNVNDFLDDDLFLPRILDKLNTNSYVGNIIWPVNKRPINNDIVEEIEKKIKENNWNFERFPNYFVHCLLSSHVYTVTNKDINKSVKFTNYLSKYNEGIKNWIVKEVRKSNENGYLGAIYINEKTKQIIVAHKGTDNFQDVYTEIEGVFNGKKVEQQVECLELINSAIKISKKEPYNLSITGHSLGGWLAEIGLYFCYKYGLKNSRAITFDSPGSMRSIERLQSNIQSTNTLIDIHNLDIITYLVEPNFVNTADKHTGKVYSLTDTSEQSNNQSTWKSWTIEKALSILTTESFKDTVLTTLNNHGLDNILKTMQCDFDSNSIEPKSEELKYKPSKYSLMSNWPLIEKKASTTTENSYTVTSMIGSFFNYAMNQINTNQPKAFHAKYGEFYSNYEINNNDLSKYEELNVDYFLSKLIDINLDNLNDQLIKSQLKELKSSFRKEINLNDKIKIVSDKFNISKIKEIMIRLLDVSNESIKEYLQSGQNLNIKLLENKNSIVKITNVLSDFPKIFISRSAELEKIKQSLNNCQYVYIYGRSGTGKTTLASKYTYLLQEEKPDYLIRWIDANKIKQRFMDLAEELKIDNKLESEELFRIIKVHLNKLNRNILFVIDNLVYDLNENIKNDFDYLLNNFDSNVKFLITTKNQLISKELSHERYEEIELNAFNQDVCIKFIDEKLNKVHKNKLQKEEWIKLFQDYSYLRLPFYLNKLISRINRKQRESFENIRIYLQNEKKEKFSTLKKENPYAYEILKYLSFLNRKKISYDFICYLMIKKELNEEEKQIEEDLINESLNYLIENSEISINYEGPFYTIHQTNQNDIISTMSEDIEKFYLKKIISILNELISDELLDKNKVRIDKVLNEYKEHSDNVLTFHSAKIENTNKNKIELLEKCANICEKVLIDNDKALKYYSKSLEIRIEKLPNNHSDISRSYNSIGRIYFNKGENEKALEYYSKSLEIRIETLSPNHPDIANSYSNTGSIYFKKGDNDKALEYYFKSLDIYKETLPPNHPDIANSYSNIGLIYFNKGENETSLEYLSKSLEIQIETLPPNHLDISNSYNNIGSIYFNKGDNDKALDYYSKSLQIRIEKMPPNHPDISRSYNNIGSIFFNKGDNEKALEYYSKSLEILKETLPANHPDIASSYYNIGSIFFNKSDIEKALEYNFKSLQIRKETLPPNHPSIATSFNNIGLIYQNKGDNDKALEYYFISLYIYKETLPPNHPDIANSYSNIGLIYFNKGENETSLEYLSKSLEIQIETLPSSHPSIAGSYNNIGEIYSNKGDNDKALEYYSKSLEIRNKIYPSNHPDIANSYDKIGSIFFNKGDNEKALEYLSKSLDIQIETLPLNHPDIALPYSKIGRIFINKSDNDKALEYLSKSLEILKETLPPNHPEIAITLYNLGFVYYKKKQFNFALEKYNESLTIFRKNFVKNDNFSIAIICHNIGFLYYKECKYDLSLNNYNESLRIKKALFGSNENISIAITHFCMAQVFESQGKLDLAQHNYSESIRIKKCSDPLHKVDDNISVPSDRFKNIAAEDFSDQNTPEYSQNLSEYGSDFYLAHKIPSFLFEHEEHRYIIGGGNDGEISVWTQNNLQYEFSATFLAHPSSSINFVCILENLNQFATASNDETIKIWDASDIANNELILLQTIQDNLLSEIKTLCYLTDLECLVSGSMNHEIRIWRRERVQNVTQFVFIFLLNEAHNGEVNSLVKLPNNYLASCSSDYSIKTWQITRGFTLDFQREMRHDLSVTCLMYLPDGNYLISGSDDQTIRIWTYLDGHLLRTLPNQSIVCSLIGLSNNRFASGSNDNLIRIWTIDLVDDDPLHILNGHLDHVICMVKINDHKLASGSQDTSIKVWNLNGNILNQTLVTDPAIINSIVYFEN